jgi:hypothetical protein
LIPNGTRLSWTRMSKHTQFRDPCADRLLWTPEDNPVKRAISCGLSSLTAAQTDSRFTCTATSVCVGRLTWSRCNSTLRNSCRLHFPLWRLVLAGLQWSRTSSCCCYCWPIYAPQVSNGTGFSTCDPPSPETWVSVPTILTISSPRYVSIHVSRQHSLLKLTCRLFIKSD